MRTFLMTALSALCLVAATTNVADAEAPLWKIATNKVKDGWVAVRLNTATGQGWAASKGKWEPIQESGDWPERGEPGTYDAVIIVDDASEWFCLRWNTKNGLTWDLNNRLWSEYKVGTAAP